MADSVLHLPTIWVLIAPFVLYWAYTLYHFASREKDLPPGPPTIPVLGNAHQLIGPKPYRRLREWGDQYGEIFSLKVGKGTIIVLNSKRAVHELLDKRSAQYAHRPHDQHLLSFSRGENIVVMNPDALWKLQRRMLVQFITPSRLDGEFSHIFEAEMKVLMQQLLSNSADYRKHIKRGTASAAAIILWGQRAKVYDDIWVKSVYDAMHKSNEALTPGSYPPVEQFPFLRFIPRRWNTAGARAEQTYDEILDIWLRSLQRIEQRREAGDKRDALVDKILDGAIKMDKELSRTQLVNFLGAVTVAASDTAACATITTVMYLAQNTDVQEKGRAELDKICGTERPPKWMDFSEAPYVNCIMKEGLRINPVAPMGFPHCATQDDWYNRMLIPKDATVLMPAYGLGRSQFDDGDTYNPDRYLNHPRLAMDYASSPDYNNRDHYAYGAGRRICAGIHLAERTQWRILANLLWGFTISPGIDETTGKEKEIDTEAYEDSFVPEPKPFPVTIKVRSAKHADVIRREFADVESVLSKWE